MVFETTIGRFGDEEILWVEAFNIYDQILISNEFLRDQVGDCDIEDCDNFRGG